jgi:hypothetical protein
MGDGLVSLGVALLLIFVLYLIDEHDLWRDAIRATLVPLTLVVLGIAIWYAWGKYRDRRDERRMAADNRKAVQACIARFPGQDVAQSCETDPQLISCSRATVPWTDFNTAHSGGGQGTADPDQLDLVDIDLSTNCFYPPSLPVRMPDGTVTEFPETMRASEIQRTITKKFPSPHAKPHPTKSTLLYVQSDVSWDLTLTSEESGGVHVGVVHPGEKVILLYSDSYSAKVKTKKGMVGWAEAGYFETVPSERVASDTAEVK